jgi:hypothetical protein
MEEIFRKALRIFQGLICKLQLFRPTGQHGPKEGALSTLFGQADAASMKYALVAAFILVAIFITLVGVGLTLFDTTSNLALS